jgi:hypothetical protein
VVLFGTVIISVNLFDHREGNQYAQLDTSFYRSMLLGSQYTLPSPAFPTMQTHAMSKTFVQIILAQPLNNTLFDACDFTWEIGCNRLQNHIKISFFSPKLNPLGPLTNTRAVIFFEMKKCT